MIIYIYMIYHRIIHTNLNLQLIFCFHIFYIHPFHSLAPSLVVCSHEAWHQQRPRHLQCHAPRSKRLPHRREASGFHRHFLGCPRKLGSMLSKWVSSPTYKWDILRSYNPLILTIDPNFLGHPTIFRCDMLYVGFRVSDQYTQKSPTRPQLLPPLVPGNPGTHGSSNGKTILSLVNWDLQ